MDVDQEKVPTTRPAYTTNGNNILDAIANTIYNANIQTEACFKAYDAKLNFIKYSPYSLK